MEPAHLQRLDETRAEHARLLEELGSPEIASDHQRYSEVARHLAELEETTKTYEAYRAAKQEAAEAREMLKDAAGTEEEEFYKTTITEAESAAVDLEVRLAELLTPRDPRDERPVIVE